MNEGVTRVEIGFGNPCRTRLNSTRATDVLGHRMGQFILVQFPSFSDEWHPFTVSSGEAAVKSKLLRRTGVVSEFFNFMTQQDSFISICS